MATQLQIRRGTASQIAAFTGAEGEVNANTTNESLHVHNGSTAGGFETARADLNNVTDASLNAALTGNTVSALTITTLTLGSTAITATGTELNYVDGVTSAIQTQLDAKAPLASPTFTGMVTAGGLSVNSGATNTAATFQSTDSTVVINFIDSVGSTRIRSIDGAFAINTGGDGGANTNTVERLRIDASGDAGLGVIPKTTHSSSIALQVGLGASIAGNTNNPSRAYLNANAYQNASNQTSYVATDEASQYFQNAGTHNFYVAPSGTADSAITWTQALTITNSGAVGLGRDPRVGLDVAGEVAIAYDANYGLRFYNQPQNNWAFIGNDVTTSAADLRLGDSTGEVMRLKGGNLLIGQTSPSGIATGMHFRPGQESGIISDGDSALLLNRLTSDGAILRFYQGSTNVGIIGSQSIGGASELFIGNASNIGLAFEQTGVDRILPCFGTTGAARDNAISLGGSSYRFKDLRLSGVAYSDTLLVGTTSTTLGSSSAVGAGVQTNHTTAAQTMTVYNSSTSCAANGIFLVATARTANSSFDILNCWTSAVGDKEFKVRGDGNVFCDGSFTGGGADYAEFFEWLDGNSSAEDRRGYSVILDSGKIRKATSEDDASQIIGVISANPAMIGDGDLERWKGKYLRDDFGAYALDENGDKQLSPDYDETQTYVSRENRVEWDIVGLMGKLRIRKGQPTGLTWIKIKDVGSVTEEWLVR